MNELHRVILGAAMLVTLTISLFLNFFDYEIPVPVVILNIVLVGGSFTWYIISQSMIKYVVKRVFEAFAVLLVIATLTFLLLRLVPGGPFDQEKTLSPEVQANIEAKYNLNAPLYKQYFMYIGGLFKGDLGQSYKYLDRSVTEIIAETLPVSFQLGLYALVVSFIMGIPLGMFAAANHNTIKDISAMLFAVSGVSLPSFLVAPIFIFVFCLSFIGLPVALWEGPSHYILPSIILGIRPAAVIARLTRASVLEVIRSDYIRTAKAKGLSQFNVMYKHVLKNSLIPVLTISGPLVAGILSGSFIMEIIFAIPGMGKHLIQSVNNRDYPLILGLTLLFSAMLVIANLIVDLLYSYFDPRIELT